MTALEVNETLKRIAEADAHIKKAHAAQRMAAIYLTIAAFLTGVTVGVAIMNLIPYLK